MNRALHRILGRAVVTTTVTLSLVAAGVGTSVADASQARDGKGATRVAVAPRVVKVITGAGITASPTGNAQAFPFKGTVAFRFPITGASPDGKRINHSGGVKLAKGHAVITLSYFRINLRRGYVERGRQRRRASLGVQPRRVGPTCAGPGAADVQPHVGVGDQPDVRRARVRRRAELRLRPRQRRLTATSSTHLHQPHRPRDRSGWRRHPSSRRTPLWPLTARTARTPLRTYVPSSTRSSRWASPSTTAACLHGSILVYSMSPWRSS